MWARSLGQEGPLEKGIATHSQYFCLGNSMDKEAWWATVHGVTKELNMTLQLNNNNLYLSIVISYCLFTMEISEVSSLLKAY